MYVKRLFREYVVCWKAASDMRRRDVWPFTYVSKGCMVHLHLNKDPITIYPYILHHLTKTSSPYIYTSPHHHMKTPYHHTSIHHLTTTRSPYIPLLTKSQSARFVCLWKREGSLSHFFNLSLRAWLARENNYFLAYSSLSQRSPLSLIREIWKRAHYNVFLPVVSFATEPPAQHWGSFAKEILLQRDPGNGALV